MRKTREEKAITLIALIITIVVLLILAVVAINSVIGDGIIQHATNAKTEYQEAQAEEESVLSYYEEYLENKGNIGPWRQSGNDIINDESGAKLAIGDFVEYDESVNGTKTGLTDVTWQVLGIEQGNLLLVSSTNVENRLGIEHSKEGYKNAIATLNNVCKKYGDGVNSKGEKIVIEARSLRVEDINKITGYNPEEAKCCQGESYEYGNEVIYSVVNNVVQFQASKNSAMQSTGVSLFEYLENGEWIQLKEGESRSFKSTAYRYEAETLTVNPDDEKIGILQGTTIYNMLFENTTSEDSENKDDTHGSYWLASQCLYGINSLGFALRIVSKGRVNHHQLTFSCLNTVSKTYHRGVRAVVKLTSNVEFELKDNIWKIK